MKIAVIHDDLMRRGGGEQVVLSMLKAFPNADLYTMCYRRELTYPEFSQYNIKTSFYNRLVKTESAMKKWFFPFGLLCMKLLRIREYDVVLISNTYCAKYVSVNENALVFIYTYTPFRLAWNPTSYQEYNTSSGLKRLIFKVVIGILKKIDAHEARKGHFYLGMTVETAQRIKDAYGVKNVEIIHPDVKCKNFYIKKEGPSDYYLVVSRLEFYKKVDLAIEAFNRLGTRLIIVGNGSKKEQLQAMAAANIDFKSGLSKDEIAALYANCKAFIFPQQEDYGITALEANASGRPVIAYGKGGVLETMIPYNGNASQFTAVFFDSQTVDSLIEAINLLGTLNPDADFIRSHAEKFDESIFIKEIQTFIGTKFNASKVRRR